MSHIAPHSQRSKPYDHCFSGSITQETSKRSHEPDVAHEAKRQKLLNRIAQIKQNDKIIQEGNAFGIEIIKALQKHNITLTLDELRVKMSSDCFEENPQFMHHLLDFKAQYERINHLLQEQGDTLVTLGDVASAYIDCQNSICQLLENPEIDDSILTFNTNLITIPPEIEELHWLKTLCIEDTKLTDLNPGICSLVNLTSLDLSNNTFLIELPDSIGNLTKLESLILSGLHLKHLPDSITHLKNLIVLSFGDCFCTPDNTPEEDNENYICKDFLTFEKLTPAQQDWVRELQSNGCTIYGMEIPETPE